MTHPGVGDGAGEAGGPWWARGLTLADRIAGPVPPRPAGGGPLADPVAERRLQAWRDDFADGRFAARLAAAGLDEAGLAAVLAEPPADLAARVGEPAWAGEVRRVLAAAPAAGRLPPPGTSWAAGFATVLAPFTDRAADRLLAAPELAGAWEVADPQALRRCFAEQVAALLVRQARRTLVLELNVARVGGELSGATPQERFADFVRLASGRDRLAALLAEYPVLARLLAQTCRHAVAAWTECLGRFAADRRALAAVLPAGAEPGRLVGLVTGAGDRHQRGRAVALLRFESGDRVVYKPRPVEVHRHFNDVVRWLNARLPGPDQATLAVLERPGYGWVEFARAAPCRDRAEVDRFYRRLGVLLALLHVLGGNDIHYENLIACAAQPVLVDLETLLHPSPARPEPLGGDPALRLLDSSVHRIALLPFHLVGDHGVLDISGLGGDRDTVHPLDVAGWEAAGTDEMRLARGPVTFPGAANRPRLDGADADPGEYAGSLLAGFRTGYQALADGADELAGPDGLLARFAADTTRVLVRPTRRYAALLDESTHPDVLRDALDRDRLLDLLWRESEGDPVREPLVTAELAELWAGDIPLLGCTPAACRPVVDGAEAGPGWAESGLEQAVRRLAGLGRTDLYDQEWIIRAALATRRRGPAGARSGARRGPCPPSVPDQERLLAAASGIADRILARAHGDRHRVNWLTLEPIGAQHWALMPQGAGLAGGYCGTALFLARLAALSGVERYAQVARRAVRPVPALLAALADRPEHLAAVGADAFDGLGGIAYALGQLTHLLADPELAASTALAVELTAAAAAQDPAPADGDPGVLAAMLAVHAATGDRRALDTADRCARRLAAGPPGPPAAGSALLRYAAATGRGEFEQPGLRQLVAAVAGPPPAVLGWDGGLTGAALAVAAAGPAAAGDPRLDRYVAAAVTTLAEHGPLPDHSLRHGEAGVLELLLAASPQGAVTGLTAGRAGTLLTALDRYGPRCATPDAVAVPGLLGGLAGIGYALLRLAFPARTPSVLLLDPPDSPAPRTPAPSEPTAPSASNGRSL